MAQLKKQDRQGARSPAALDRQYNIGGMALQYNKNATKQSKQTEQLIAEINALRVSLGKMQEEMNSQSLILSASGTILTVIDATKSSLKGLTLYGKSTQSGIPTLENPIPITSIGEEGGIAVMSRSATTADSTTIAASTPNGLHGIPVVANGNYTDENGQQWISDEIDFEHGLFIKRIEKIESYEGQVECDVFLSTTGELSEGATVLYPLSSAKVTTISKKDMEQFAAMRTYQGITIVQNFMGGYTEIKYVADIKTYIDNKLGGGA